MLGLWLATLAVADSDQDGDGFKPDEGDCDDHDDTVYPGAPEDCNGNDDDCDDVIPADEIDDDRDGFAECEGDCDDANDAVGPGAREVCNGIDDDCDGVIDPGCGTGGTGGAGTTPTGGSGGSTSGGSGGPTTSGPTGSDPSTSDPGSSTDDPGTDGTDSLTTDAIDPSGRAAGETLKIGGGCGCAGTPGGSGALVLAALAIARRRFA